MPCDYSKYPKNWKTEIVPAARERAGHRCEDCGVPNYAVGTRDATGAFQPVGGNLYADEMQYAASYAEAKTMLESELENWAANDDEPTAKPIMIVLTIAHTHNSDPMDCRPENLRALCQRCHNRLDAPMRRKNAAATRAAKKSLPLFVHPSQR